MCGDQEIWSKTEYNRIIRNRVEHIGNIKDVAECRSGVSRDRSHVVGVPEGESIVRWRRVGEPRMRLGSHVTGVRSPGRSRSFGYLTQCPCSSSSHMEFLIRIHSVCSASSLHSLAHPQFHEFIFAYLCLYYIAS
jgi:hypothetical protein